MNNEAKARALLKNVRAIDSRSAAATPNNKLGLRFFDEPEPALLAAHPSRSGDELGSPITLEQAKALHIQRTLIELDWNVTHAAKVLAVTRRTLHRMINRYELDPKRKKATADADR